MELQEVGKYKVEPFALERILDLEYVKTMNDHAKLYVRGVLKEGEEDRMIGLSWDEMPVMLTEKGRPLFCGVATDVGVICESGVYYLEAEAVSWTIKLDRVKKKRSFQEKGRSYESIVQEIAAAAGGIAFYEAPDKKIENVLLQYRETDWEFLKRLASHSNSALVPVLTMGMPAFSVGIAHGGVFAEETAKADYSVRKKVSRYRQLSQSDEISYKEKDAVEYTVRTEHAAAGIGDKIIVKGKMLYVREARLSLKGSVFLCTCVATTKSGVSAPEIDHPYISGLTLEGKVIKVVNDTVKVHLSIDKSQDEATAYPFPYATSYSAEGHTGWYVMPEVGDTVQVIFPTEDGNKAYAMQSFRQKQTERTTDPGVKYLRTADGKEIKLDKDEILITAEDDLTYIRINKDSGVDVFTIHEVNVLSADSITLMSGNDISMSCLNDFNVVVGKDMKVNVAGSIDITNKDNNLNMEPKKGISMTAEKPIKISSSNSMDIASKKKFTACTKDEMDISSAKNLNISSKKKMILTASKALQENCKGSAIRIDGNVTIKARLIKEN